MNTGDQAFIHHMICTDQATGIQRCLHGGNLTMEQQIVFTGASGLGKGQGNVSCLDYRISRLNSFGDAVQFEKTNRFHRILHT